MAKNRVRSHIKSSPVRRTTKTTDLYSNWGAYAYSHTTPYWNTADADLTRDDWGRSEAYKLVGTVNRCVDLLSQAVNDLDWHIVRDSDGKDEIVASSEDRRPRHPAAQAIHEVFADQGSPLFSLWVNSRSLYGETYIEKRLNDFGRRRQLTWLYPFWCEPETGTGRITGYRYGDKNGQSQEWLTPDMVAFDRTHNPTDGLRGLSKIDTALPDINGGRELKRFIKWTLANNARPGLIASPRDSSSAAVPTMLGDTQVETLQRILSDSHIGTRNASTAIVMPSQFDFTTLEGPELDKYRALMEEFKKDICITFGVPLAMAGDSSSTTFKDGEEVRKAFYINTVIPLAHLIQDFFNIKLMPFLDADGDCTFQFDTAEFEDSTRTDREVADLIHVRLQGSYLTLNEARIAQGLEAMPELNGLVMVSGVPTPLARIGQPAPAPQFGFGQSAPQMTVTSPPTPPIEQSDPQKGAASLCVMLSLANNPDLVDLQKRLKAMYPDPAVRWNDPSDFHVTLLYVPAVDDEQIDTLVEYLPAASAEGLSLKVGSLACFDNVGEHALHFRIARNSGLLDTQAALFEACEAAGLQASGHSHPERYIPHITMGYLPETIGRITFHGKISVTPNKVICSVERGGEDEIVYPIESDNQDDDAATKSAHTHSHTHDFPKALPVAEWREKALNELKAWQRRVRVGKSQTFEPVHTRGFIADMLLEDLSPESFDRAFAAVRHEPLKATLARLDRAFDPITRKDIGETRQEFEDEFLIAIADAKDGAITTAQLGALLNSVIDTLGEQAFFDGLEDGGVKDPALDEDDQATIARLTRQAKTYVADFVSKFDTYTDLQLDQRPRLWANQTLNDFYMAGLTSADANGVYEWRLGKTEQHCVDCLGNNGLRKRLKNWVKGDILPKSQKLACGGWECDCGLFNIRGGARG